ncbi:MAG TPA: WGR domain-containing protein [Mycobacteriales bacterium]|jgi:predicted DNA-binding WGR domain protein|nr:WGR domain-containing protein [Mycobacteriales bacterium]
MTYQVSAQELRCTTGTSNKFYRTYVVDRGDEAVAVFQHGRIGTYGRFQIGGTPAMEIAAKKRRQKRSKGYQPHASRAFDIDPQAFDDAYERNDAYTIGWNLEQAFRAATDLPIEPDPEPAPPAPTRERSPRTRRTSNLATLVTRGEELLNEVLAGGDPLERVGAVLQYHADVAAARTTVTKAEGYVSMLTEKVRSAV